MLQPPRRLIAAASACLFGFLFFSCGEDTPPPGPSDPSTCEHFSTNADTLEGKPVPKQRVAGAVVHPDLYRWECPSGDPIANHRIYWFVTTGGGSVATDTTVTDTNGYATVPWTLGDIKGIQHLSAEDVDSPEISPALFTANVGFSCDGYYSQGGVLAGTTQLWYRTDKPYTFSGSYPVEGTLRITAGVTVCMGAGERISVHEGGKLEVIGTEANPVVFEGPSSSLGALEFEKQSANPPVAGYIVQARLHDVRIIGYAPVYIDSTSVVSEEVILQAPGSHFASSKIDGGILRLGPRYSGTFIFVDATVTNGGVYIDGPNVSLQGCDISNSGNAVYVQPFNNNDDLSTIHINSSNLYGNSGFNIIVDSTSHNGNVDAKDNWWGSPTTVKATGNIDTSNPRASVAPLGYRPPD